MYPKKKYIIIYFGCVGVCTTISKERDAANEKNRYVDQRRRLSGIKCSNARRGIRIKS